MKFDVFFHNARSYYYQKLKITKFPFKKIIAYLGYKQINELKATEGFNALALMNGNEIVQYMGTDIIQVEKSDYFGFGTA